MHIQPQFQFCARSPAHRQALCVSMRAKARVGRAALKHASEQAPNRDSPSRPSLTPSFAALQAITRSAARYRTIVTLWTILRRDRAVRYTKACKSRGLCSRVSTHYPDAPAISGLGRCALPSAGCCSCPGTSALSPPLFRRHRPGTEHFLQSGTTEIS